MIIRLFAFTGLIILSPLVFLASLLIYFEDGSPAIFKQKRLGKNMKNLRFTRLEQCAMKHLLGELMRYLKTTSYILDHFSENLK